MSLGYVILILIVYVLAVMRLVRILNADTILDPLRIALARRVRDEERSEVERGRWSTLEYFVGCPWCVGLWLAAATSWIPPVIVGWPLWWWPLIALATSHLVGVCARFSADDDIAIETT